jgi:hypothetical protein
MTAAIPTQPLTISVFLFGEAQDTEQALAQALHEQGVLGSTGTALELVSEAGREAVADQVAVVANGFLDLDLGDLVVAGWRKQGQLAAAAERTAANPGSSEVVELATHRISSAHRPYVELLVNDAHVATVNFDLDIEFVVRALVVTVRDGQVVSLHTGACDVAATLAAEGIQLASRRAPVELPLVLRLPLLLRLDGGSDPSPYAGDAAVPSFERDIRPLFTERDRVAMRWAFDLGEVASVRQHAEAILKQVAAGRMPCDAPWPAERVALFRRWVEAGSPD